MRLGATTGGECSCYLCEWGFGFDSPDEATKGLRDHLGLVHQRLMVTTEDKKPMKSGLPRRVFYGPCWPREL